MKTFLLIMTMTGSWGGGIATATFDDLDKCKQAGTEFAAMNKNVGVVSKFICVEN
jgi:hypothetical protein